MPSANPSYIFREIIPLVALFNNDSININEKVEYWKSEELESDIFDEKYVIVWQWCKKTAQEDKSIWRLNNKFWIPYLFDHNKLIEEEFQKNNKSAKISIPSCNFNKEIIFSEDSCFAFQRDEITSKLRNVRRIILSIKDLKKILNNNNLIKISIDNLKNLFSFFFKNQREKLESANEEEFNAFQKFSKTQKKINKMEEEVKKYIKISDAKEILNKLQTLLEETSLKKKSVEEKKI